MDKTTYLTIKKERAEKILTYPRENFCHNCVRLLRNCLCSLISPFQTHFHFVILMHPKEAKKEKIGTGKISQLSLINSEIIIGVDFTEHDYINTMIKNPNNYCIILYPGNKSINLSQDNVEPLLDKSHEEKQLVVFLIDGTWPCAKKMMRLSLNLKTLPRVSFSIKNKSIFEIKQQPAEYCLSTLESIYYFIKVCNLKGLEKTFGQEDQMINVFKAMIDYQIKCSLDINLASYKKKKIGYSKSSDRKQSKKWLNRNIILID